MELETPVMWRSRLAAVVGVLAALVGVRTVVAYLSHGAYFALATVVVLIAVDGAGLFSLMRARRAVLDEWQKLRAPEPVSRLWQRRREKLLALKVLQTPPDVDALMAVDEAELAGLASFGRYLVAASVLIGLVGTFAGLSETIAGFAPVMSSDGEMGTRLLAPLSGLEVTFGASIVAIIATLALSLAAGDLVLAERALLARLEERTRHELVPLIFPVSESLAAQTLVALAAMTANLSREWAQTTSAQAERMESLAAATAARFADDARAASAAMREENQAAATRVAEASANASQLMVASATAVQQGMTTTGAASVQALAMAAESAAHTFAATSSDTARTMNSASTLAIAAMAKSANAASEAMITLSAAAAKTVATAGVEASEAMITTSANALSRLEALTAALAQAFATTATDTWAKGASDMRAAAERLETAAQALAHTTERLHPSVEHLVPELAALSRETALLAARVDDAEVDEAVLAEMQRLGEAMGEIKTLLTLGQPTHLAELSVE